MPSQPDDKIEVRCVVCKRKFLIAPAIHQLMLKIGVITCGVECATKWIEQND